MRTPTLLPAPALAAALSVLCGSAAAQDDRIVFTDGTVAEKVTVTGFNLREVEWRSRNGARSRPSDAVADLRVEKVLDSYRRAYSASKFDAPGTFLTRARALKSDPFMAQFGFVEAARLFVGADQYSDAFTCLEELQATCPDSGFVPVMFRTKLDYYIGKGDGRSATKVASDYSTAAQTQGFPAGAVVEAEYYVAMAKTITDSMNPAQLRQQMATILQKATDYPHVAERARLQVANALRQEGKLDEAMGEYDDLLGRSYVSEDVRAGAWLGVGHIHFKRGDPSNREPYYHAMLAFLRVVVETPDAAPAIVAEALHMGSQATDKWGGEDAGRMGRRLRQQLARDFPDNPWTKR